MKYIDEFRNPYLIKKCAKAIKSIAPSYKINIMEVCGTHTQNFYRFGLDELMPDSLSLIAGPGCPVCVSPQGYIDAAIKLIQKKNVIVVSFGDMLRTPGSRSTLEKERAKFGNVQVAYSALDSLRLAELNPDKHVVFLGVGFETTAPTVALSIILARQKRIKNLSFLTSLKLIPPVLSGLIKDKKLNISAFLCPGHVSAIIGTKSYEFIPSKFKASCCVAGFEPLDMLEGIHFLLLQILSNRPSVTNQYSRVVTKNGNLKAQKIMRRAFKISDANWRGIGLVKKSGLKINEEFSEFDAENKFSLKKIMQEDKRMISQCRCADVLKGLILPKDCKLFGKACIPDNPQGPCMISSEGTCSAYYKYKK